MYKVSVVAGRVRSLIRLANLNRNLDGAETAVDGIPNAQIEKRIVLQQVYTFVRTKSPPVWLMTIAREGHQPGRYAGHGGRGSQWRPVQSEAS